MKRVERRTTKPNPKRKMRKVLNERQASEFTGFSIKHLQNLRYRGIGPAYCKIGASIRYIREDLISWIENHRIDGASQ